MKRAPASLVLAFYSEASAALEGSRQGLTVSKRACFLGRPSIDDIGPQDLRLQCSSLLLEGEFLVAVEMPPDAVEAVVSKLRAVGSPAIFVIRAFVPCLTPPTRTSAPLAGDRLKEYFRDLARQQGKLDGRRPAKPAQGHPLLGDLKKCEGTIESARADLAQASRLGHEVTAAAEWLLDNFYLVKTHASDVRRHLPKAYSQILPALESDRKSVRIHALAVELVAQTDHSINETNISDCLREYQTVEPLTIAEIWAFPLMLRLASLDALARLSSHISEAQQLREAAYLWANRLAASSRQSAAEFQRILGLVEAEPIALMPSFLSCLAELLQVEESTLVPVQRWMEERVQTPFTELLAKEQNEEAAERVSISNAFQSLRTLDHADITSIFEEVSLVHHELSTDPAGTYAISDFATRDSCRRAVEELSRGSGIEELEVARRAVAMAAVAEDPRHRELLHYLVGSGIAELETALQVHLPVRRRLVRAIRRNSAQLYFESVLALTVGFVVIALSLAWEAGGRHFGISALLAALAIIPLSELASQIVNALVISLLPPDQLPKLDFTKGVPPEHATLVVIPMLLSSLEVARNEVEKLEVRYLANPEANVAFSLFSDFTDAGQQSLPGDASLLKAAKDGIDQLNIRYPGGHFLLFHRSRIWSESEQCWLGRERKRGKLEELNAFLCGNGSAEIVARGHLALPIHYVITLDADTQLPPGAARRMIEAIAHPLNRVEINPVTRVRDRGFTIIQPRVSVSLPSATATRFARVFADAKGTDPYCQAVSDAQQDLFGDAIYHGKAIYDVRAFHTILDDRFPLETLLSHDLIEGAYAGVAFASDIELFEGQPLEYGSYSQRQNRWIRGDWQIASWAFSYVPSADGVKVTNPLNAINRWRILDNLRRSLVPVTSLLLLLIAWLISAAPAEWSVVMALAVAIPALAPFLDRVVRKVDGTVHRWRGALDELIRATVMTALLPHQAWVTVDAIVRVLYRKTVSHRGLLEWQTAEAVNESAVHHMSRTRRQLLWISGVSVTLMLVARAHGAFVPMCFFLVLWALSPALVYFLDVPLPTTTTPQVPHEKDVAFLRQLARRTWRFFDDLVGPASNFLPPDNTQTALRIEVAHRTSPTNIGLAFASTLGAFDLGYLTIDGLERRTTQMLATVQRLERYEGHLLNWYDTITLEPLLPRYVSTVDSGNLLASLWVLEQGCQDAARAPLLGPQCLRGLTDTLSLLTESSENGASIASELKELRRLFGGDVHGHELIGRLRLASVPLKKLAGMRNWVASADDESGYLISSLIREVEAWIEIADQYLPWMDTLTQPPDSLLRSVSKDAVEKRRRAVAEAPSLSDLAVAGSAGVALLLALRTDGKLAPRVATWLDQVAEEYKRAQAAAAATLARLRKVEDDAGRLASGINMSFLYDKGRRLFGIGYAVGGPLEFNNYYDLLASECRLASLVSIAKGDVPVSHWFALGRPRATTEIGDILLSWGGTMFEYLMPGLFAKGFANSLLDDACRQAVKMQIEYGRLKGVPWGVSEAAYSALDAHQIYQYKLFGVPRLGLKPGLGEDLVVSPYSTVLALQVDPQAALDNMERLTGYGLAGPMGFYESIDFNRESAPNGERGVVVQAYMSHHQGMSMLSLVNTLCDGVMQTRFHADLRIRAVEAILYEQIPVTRPTLLELDGNHMPVRRAVSEDPAVRSWSQDTAAPKVYLQGNERYSLMVTNSGGGYSRYNDFDLTRWRADATVDAWGSFLYLRDLQAGTVWATTYQPTGGRQGTCLVRMSSDRAEFQRQAYGIDAVTEVTVGAEDDVELRRVTLTNRSLRTRQLEITSYAELVLAPHNADRAHPAFAKMFVDTECIDGRILIARHRPRSPGDAQIWAAHLIIGERDSTQFETDRGKFLGRTNSPSSPDAMRGDLTGTVGAVFDPIFSLRAHLTLNARERRQLTFVTLAATSRESLMALIAKYEHPDVVTRDFELAWTRAQLRFRYLGIGEAAAQRFQDLASYMVYPNPRLRAPESRLARNRLGQERLWAYGISGDLPILTVVISETQNLALARELLLAHTYWRIRGFKADLVILNQEAPAYDRPLRSELQGIIDAHSAHTGRDRPGGVFLRDWHAIPDEDRELILAASSVMLYGGRGSLLQQLMLFAESPAPPVFKPTDGTHEVPSQPLPFLELPYFNGIGGFKPDGSEYAIYLKPGYKTPSPWVNVMANPSFGSMVSESGLGFTWAGNSQTNRLTPWHNDAVRDPQSEVIYLRDAESGAVWTPTPLPIAENDAYRARHGQGFTVYEHNSHSISQELTVFIPLNDPVKVYRLRLKNDSTQPRTISVMYFAELVLGTSREEQQLHVQTNWDKEAGAVFARNPWNAVHSGSVAFASSWPAAKSYSGDRAEFLGRNGSVARPAAVDDARLNNRTGAGLDPAAALQVELKIEPGREALVVFLLGQTATVEEARDLIVRYRTAEQAETALAATRHWWADRLNVITVRTPVLSVDLLLNRWLPYQTLSCRMWGRSALYQSGGAFGFRDQLQDSMALLYAWPEVARAHILKSAARQFVEGDAQHWWHPETGSGVRTRCSDDLVWLPYVVARYVEVTGDLAILDEDVAFIDGNPLAEGESERMFTPTVSAQSASLRDHCIRALNHASGLGAHALPLIGNGDWNDGLSLVGVGGKGESVWLAWFLHEALTRFAPLVETLDSAQATTWRSRADTLAEAAELHAWDGEWYLRAFFDSGEPLGSNVCKEAKIDSLSQSWAVISGAADPARARTAMHSANRLLVKQAEKLVLLFDPPFEHSEPNPGYIMGYPPGVRENGGQYTHGSLWLAMAWARLRDGNAAVRTLLLMNPVEHSRDPKGVETYQGEPYVSPADVYFAPGKVGRAGWTWYSGSSGWMYRIWLEEVLGFHLRGGVLKIDPVIPDEWPGFDITYRHRSATYEIKVLRDRSISSVAIEEDGRPLVDGAIQLADDNRIHRIVIRLPQARMSTSNSAIQVAPETESRHEADTAELSGLGKRQ